MKAIDLGYLDNDSPKPIKPQVTQKKVAKCSKRMRSAIEKLSFM